MVRGTCLGGWKEPAARSESGKVRRVVVVGAGISGLMTALRLAEARVPVDVLSILPAIRSHSGVTHGDFDAAIDAKGEGDSARAHLEDTIAAGEDLADQPLANGMVLAAPTLLALLDRMGVPFHRTAEGTIEARRGPGSGGRGSPRR